TMSSAISRRVVVSSLVAATALGGKLSRAVAAATAVDGKSLSAALGCPVVTPGDGVKYRIACDVWNGLVSRKPAYFVTCKSAADVSRTVLYARQNGIPLSVKGGGHHPAGFALCDGGLTLDVSGMTDIQIDKANKRATIGPTV